MLRRFAPLRKRFAFVAGNDGGKLRELVVPRACGGSSTPQLLGSITAASGILGHPLSRVTTTEYDFAISRHKLSEVCLKLPALSNHKGAGKTGCALHPWSRVQLRTKSTHSSIQVQRKHSGLPCAMALRLTSCSPGERLSCHRRSTSKLAKLGASTAASGPHDLMSSRFSGLLKTAEASEKTGIFRCLPDERQAR